jgi:hypothetical protein
LEGGVALLTVSYLLGHAQVTTTNTYAATSDVVAEREPTESERPGQALQVNRTPGLSID